MRRGFRPVFCCLILGAFFLPPELPAAPADRISGYTAVFLPQVEPEAGVAVAIRRYEQKGISMALVLDPRRLTVRSVSWATVRDRAPVAPDALASTPFGRSLFTGQTGKAVAATPPYPPYSLFLTIDLCPSGKALDRSLFRILSTQVQDRPFPVGLAVAGNWIRRHREDFAWLLSEERLGKLAITWINHTATHPYRPGLPATQNFLCLPGVDARQEILRNEILLLETGVPLSPFFRFPGLIATEALQNLIASLSLIPVNSDAWLAKGEKPQPGGILLVHGNGNEPEGVRAFERFLRTDWPAWKERGGCFLPLPRAFGAEGFSAPMHPSSQSLFRLLSSPALDNVHDPAPLARGPATGCGRISEKPGALSGKRRAPDAAQGAKHDPT